MAQGRPPFLDTRAATYLRLVGVVSKVKPDGMDKCIALLSADSCSQSCHGTLLPLIYSRRGCINAESPLPRLSAPPNGMHCAEVGSTNRAAIAQSLGCPGAET